MAFLTLSWKQQLYAGLVILVLIPLSLAFAFQSQIYDAYLQQFVRPGLEREFGFQAGHVRLSGEAGGQEAFAIIRVTKDGALWQAGFRPGDLPVGYKHGFATGFYHDLLRVRSGASVDVLVVSATRVQDDKAWRRRLRIEPHVAH